MIICTTGRICTHHLTRDVQRVMARLAIPGHHHLPRPRCSLFINWTKKSFPGISGIFQKNDTFYPCDDSWTLFFTSTVKRLFAKEKIGSLKKSQKSDFSLLEPWPSLEGRCRLKQSLRECCCVLVLFIMLVMMPAGSGFEGWLDDLGKPCDATLQEVA